MASTAVFPFNDLPPELQSTIFVTAANLDRSSSKRLILVAKRMYRWVLPCLYNTVALGEPDTERFLRSMQTIPAYFFGTNVKNLCLSISINGRDAQSILSVCTGVRDLAFWVDFLGSFPGASIAPFIQRLPLHRLSIEINHFISLFAARESQPVWCDSLTHLDITFWTVELFPVIPHLDELPALTHLSLRLLHNQVEETSVLNILVACRRLQVLVIFEDSDTIDSPIWPVDPRVVSMPYSNNPVVDWETQARHDDSSTWSRAEELVRSHVAERERAAAASA